MKVGDVLYDKIPTNKYLWFYRGETQYGYIFDMLVIENDTGYTMLSRERLVPEENFENIKMNLVNLHRVDYDIVFSVIFTDIVSLEVEK